MHMLQTHAPVIFLLIIFILMHFRLFSTIHTFLYDMHEFFILSHFQERFQIYEFSIKTLKVVWTEGLNASKCMHFQMKTH